METVEAGENIEVYSGNNRPEGQPACLWPLLHLVLDAGAVIPNFLKGKACAQELNNWLMAHSDNLHLTLRVHCRGPRKLAISHAQM